MRSVTSDTLAASTLQVAGIRAWTISQINLQVGAFAHQTVTLQPAREYCFKQMFSSFQPAPSKGSKDSSNHLIRGENLMKILVVYDTTSAQRNTEKVATAISEVLKAKGLDVDCTYVGDVDPANVRNYDCVLSGSPTQAFRATKPIMQFLDRFAKNEFTGRLGAAFDTQLQSRMSGNAAKGIEKKLENLGFKIVVPPLVTYVEGKMEEVHLKEGEVEKAKKYAEDLANKLQQ